MQINQNKQLRTAKQLKGNWIFTGPDGKEQEVNLPHTWNAQDGQDGGNDYYRGTCHYKKTFAIPEFDSGTQRIYLEFCGVSASANVMLNGRNVLCHDGGYSTFRTDITDMLEEQNILYVSVDNGTNTRIYPQKADFTFYGGIYRDVFLRIVPKNHFELDYYGGEGIKITPTVQGNEGIIRVESFHQVPNASVVVTLRDAEGNVVVKESGEDIILSIPAVHLWDGVDDPYLYTAEAALVKDGEIQDIVCIPFGIRSFFIDPEKGFFLNGRSYPLRGVSRHQDWKGRGNALAREQHEEDMKLIREVGANSIRLAHYQHDQYFYELCDRYGMIVWAEIPYISEHMSDGRQNTRTQMKELIVQNYNHPSIVTWGISNEITISTKDKRDMLDNHHELNQLCHKMDPTRPTSLACYAMCGPLNKVAHLSDLVGWNLYLGWYVPGLFLNDWWISMFHRLYPRRCLGYSEYGCEGMPNLHSSQPRRGDHTEEYQSLYHEFMLKCFARHPFMWSTYVWNMFDFASDARNQGGEPGINHKGLVTFDRKIKKDSFYLYKAYWSKDPFVHLCGSRYVDRTEAVTTVKVYSNQEKVTLYANGRLVEEKGGDKVFVFRVALKGEVRLEAVAGECKDTCKIRHVSTPNLAYKLIKSKGKSQNWV